MKKPLIIILSLLLFLACNKTKEENTDDKELIYGPEYSVGFNIMAPIHSQSRIINVYNPWQGAKDLSSSFLISRDGKNSDDFKGQALDSVPQRIICMSSTHIAMLEDLGATDKIVGVSGMQYISNPYIHKHKDEIADIGYEGNIDYEKLIAADPDLVMLFSVNGASGMETKLKELGIPYIYIGDYVEETPLGKTEWIVAIAEILGMRDKGIQKFKEIESRYLELKEKVAKTSHNRPKIMVNMPFLGSWFMPSTTSYVAQMINDAGGDYIYTKNTGNTSKPIDIEEALHLVGETDFWINIGNLGSLDELKATLPIFTNTKCVKEGYIFNNNLKATPEGGNDCYESGMMHPDLILKDLIKIFHPELIEDDFTYYKQLK